jgi:hypothetical protein
MTHNVWRNTAVVFAAGNDVRGAAMERLIMSRRSAHSKTRQKQWSEHYKFFLEL